MKDETTLGFWQTVSTIYHDACGCSGMVPQIARLRGAIDERQLRQALYLVHYRQPMLHASIHAEHKRYFGFKVGDVLFPPTEDGLQALPFKTFQREDENQWVGLTEQETMTGFDPEKPYLWRLTLLKNNREAGTHELILVAHHAISDALSTARFMHTLLSYYAEIDTNGFPSEPPEKLAARPPAEKIVVKPQHLPAPTPSVQEDSTARVSWPLEQKADVSNRTNRLHFRSIGPEKLSALLKRCKEERTTVNSALTAALLSALIETPTEPSRTSINAAVGLRGYCDPKIDEELFGCYIAMMEFFQVMRPEDSFWDLARQCGTGLRKTIEDKWRQRFLPKRFDRTFLAAKVIQELEEHHDQGVAPSGPGISNLGVLKFPESYGELTLDELYFSSSQTSGYYAFFLSVLTFRKTLFCCFSHVSPLFGEQHAHKTMNAFNTILDQALS